MKTKIPKASFIQHLVHVFMGHFESDTFTYTVSEVKKLENWCVEKEQTPHKIAYKIDVIQSYQGKYEKFNFQQKVFVVKHKEKLTIMWDYN